MIQFTVKTLDFQIHATEVDENQYVYLQFVTPVSLDKDTLYGIHLIPTTKVVDNDQEIHFVRSQNTNVGNGSQSTALTITAYNKASTSVSYNFYMTAGAGGSFRTDFVAEEASIQLSPNPVSTQDAAWLTIPNVAGEVLIAVYDLAGNKVLQKSAYAENGQALCPINVADAGLYVVQYYSQDGMKKGSLKLVVKP